MESRITIAIADLNALLREGLRRLLNDHEDLGVVLEAATDAETLTLIEQVKPDLLLLDLQIPKMEAVPLQLAIKARNLATRVLILSSFCDESHILNTARAGARGYILKSTPFSMLEAIREVFQGHVWADRQTRFADTFGLLSCRASYLNDSGPKTNPLYVLSRRELQILDLMAEGPATKILRSTWPFLWQR